MPNTEGFSYDPELGPGYFVQARSDFLRSPAFTPTAKVLYLVLCSYAGEGVTAWPGQERLATECGVSERTIRRTLPELTDTGLLTMRRQGLNKPNLYHVHKLPTLPPKAERSQWPFQDRTKRPLQSSHPVRSRSAPESVEVQSVQEHTAEIQEGGAVSPIKAPDAFAVQRGDAPSRATLPGEPRR